MKEKNPKKPKCSPRKRGNERKKRDKGKELNLALFGELRLIRIIKNHYSGFKATTRHVGIGDDCAVIGTAGPNDILVTTDTQMEGIHFISKFIPPELVGERSVAITLSDIAAMGGQAQYLFLNLGLPRMMDSGTALKIVSAIHKACKRHKVSLLGGDTFRSPRGTILCLTALGKIEKGRTIFRKGAEVKDDIFLTGTVGSSALGLELLRRGFQTDGHHPLQKNISRKEQQEARKAIERHRRPLPHLPEGKFFAQEGFANAMIDISDGLSADLYNLCQASGVGAIIYESDIPLDSSLTCFIKDRRRALKIALSGGEDYCLLLTIPKKKSTEAMRKFQRRFSRQLFKIGEIVPIKEGFHLVSRSGRVQVLSRKGYEHFRKSIHRIRFPLR